MHLKTPAEIEIMREGGHKLAAVLAALAGEVHPGVRTIELDTLAHDLILASGAKPAFLNYHPAGAKKAYPYTLCISLNDVVVHGQPSDRVIEEGNIVSLDLGLIFQKFYLDSAITVGAGEISKAAKLLLSTTKESLTAGIEQARIGKTLGDIGYAIDRAVSRKGFSVAEGLVGHGIGKSLHEDPVVFNYGDPHEGENLVPGLVIAIEPMVCIGSGETKTLRDESYATRDGSLSAHFEHTVAITKDGPIILTK